MSGYKNNKKSFLDNFIPREGDSRSDVARKVVTDVSVIVLAVAAGVALPWDKVIQKAFFVVFVS